jgi:hypothetical protein
LRDFAADVRGQREGIELERWTIRSIGLSSNIVYPWVLGTILAPVGPALRRQSPSTGEGEIPRIAVGYEIPSCCALDAEIRSHEI